jgi:hypothetical protein
MDAQTLRAETFKALHARDRAFTFTERKMPFDQANRFFKG